MKTLINKQKSHAFSKDVYLLGADEQGTKYWLEAPSWDYDGNWGFGYVETYTNNNNPSKARDINSHQHVSGFMGKQEIYDHEKGWINGEYIHNIYDSPKLQNTTFTEKEGWILSELFERFYTLREAANMFGRGGCNKAYNSFSLQKQDWAMEINGRLIPEITDEIIRILTP